MPRKAAHVRDDTSPASGTIGQLEQGQHVRGMAFQIGKPPIPVFRGDKLRVGPESGEDSSGKSTPDLPVHWPPQPFAEARSRPSTSLCLSPDLRNAGRLGVDRVGNVRQPRREVPVGNRLGEKELMSSTCVRAHALAQRGIHEQP